MDKVRRFFWKNKKYDALLNKYVALRGKFPLMETVISKLKDKRGDKVIVRKLLVIIKGEVYHVKFIVNPNEGDSTLGIVLGRSFLKTSRGIVDLGKGVMTIYPDPNPFHDNSDSSDDPRDEWDDLMENIDFGDIPEIDELLPFVYKLKLDEEIEEGEEEAIKEVIRNYKTLREKNDPRVFVIPIRVEGKYDTHTLADTGSNINVLPYGIYMQIGAGEVEAIADKIRMLDHSRAEPMGILRDVLCQVGVITILTRFLVLDIPVDKDVPIVVRRTAIKVKTEEENNDSEKEIFKNRDKDEKPIYGPDNLENDSSGMERGILNAVLWIQKGMNTIMVSRHKPQKESI
ncbi:reverse transcriptase domain-containing protein [Tanacetum coccineum]|uniref:Reverse transcriptase domain-containing protein n=1 Tax=Tanacetum coccineum TaxID=301880 RepID=A0ABQ5H4Y3_9ASTR